MLKAIIQTLLASTLLMVSSRVFAQGALSVNPISTYTPDAEGVLKINIQNLTDKQVRFEMTRDCDVDGNELSGEDCNKYLKITTNAEQKENTYLVLPRDRVAVTVSLAKAVKSYALFKPLIRAILGESGPKNGITFEFNHRPGLLFLINPDQARFGDVKFSTRTSDAAQIASFKIDISQFTTPHVVNISAKLMNSTTKKLVRFARLGEEQILDPRRKLVDLEVEYGRKDDPAEKLCYELFIQEKSSKSNLQKLTNCGS